MKIRKLLIAGVILFPASNLLAQEAPVPVQAVLAAPQPKTVLPAGTEVPLKMSQTVTTKGKGWNEGDQFNLNVATNIMIGDYIVIPEGTKAVGRITWLTSRGAFGKSGKMDVELEYLLLGGRRINLDGTFRQEGNGATLATVGGVIAAGVFAGFITGRSGVIPQGRELLATLESDLPVALPEGTSVAPSTFQATAAPRTQAAIEAQAIADEKQVEEAEERAAKSRPPAEIKIDTKRD